MFSESLKTIALRFVIYSFVIFGCMAAISIIDPIVGIAFYKENGPLELAQLCLLVGAGTTFFIGSFYFPNFSQLFFFLSSFFAFAVIRELDSLLSSMIPWVGWKVGFVILLLAMVLSYINRNILKNQIRQFIAYRSFAILWVGFLVAVPIAQMLGHGEFLQYVMGDDYIRGYKRVIEESGEVIGYCLLFMGSIESLVQIRWLNSTIEYR